MSRFIVWDEDPPVLREYQGAEMNGHRERITREMEKLSSLSPFAPVAIWTDEKRRYAWAVHYDPVREPWVVDYRP